MTHRQKTLGERQLVDVADLTDSTGGTSSDTLAAATNIDALTDATGGTADNTVGPVADIALSTSDTYTDAAVNAAVNAAITEVNNDFKELVDQVITQKALNTVVINALASLAAKQNEILEIIRKDI